MRTQEDELIGMIRGESVPIEPRPARVPEEFQTRIGRALPRLPSAVLFDIYGTLFVSASGDVGTSAEQSRADRFAQSIERTTGTRPSDELARRIEDAYYSAIRSDHATAREAGRAHPEVDIVSIWDRIIPLLAETEPKEPLTPEQLAVAFELSSNPVWPMPGANEIIRKVGRSPLRLGIVSNAQFYTPLLFPALLGRDLDELGFERSLSSFSYVARIAKPDPSLFAGPLAVLHEAGIDSERIVYVGNDMLNDVVTANSVGCMTILFAGDERSLRLRRGDPRVESVLPDSVITSLEDLGELVAGPE